MKKNITLISLPYDSAHFNERMGAGPLHIINSGLIESLQAKGHDMYHKQIVHDEPFPTEIATAFKLLQQVKTEVGKAIQKQSFPIVLSGNCSATVGILAGNCTTHTGLIWLDAHADCETPESTTSGFLDGMGLSMALNSCWKNLMLSTELNTSLTGNNVVLMGARSISTGEQTFITNNRIHHITVDHIKPPGKKAIKAALSELKQNGIDEVHLHVDVDVIDPSVAPANSYATGNGLSKEDFFETITLCINETNIKSVTIASYDPSYDKQNEMLNIIKEIIEMLIR